jgi:hypothetical protein
MGMASKERKVFFSEEKNQKTFPLINQATRKERLGGEPPPRPRRKLISPQGDTRSLSGKRLLLDAVADLPGGTNT